MKIIILAFILRSPFFQDSLPPRAELFATLRTFHAENADANAAALNIVERRAWTTLLPTFGVALGKPTIGFSVGQYFDWKFQKTLRAAERSKILRGSNLNFRSDSFALVALLERYRIIGDAVPYLERFESFENARFEILKEKQAKGLLLNAEDRINAQSSNLRSGEALRAKREEMLLLEIEVLKTAKY